MNTAIDSATKNVYNKKSEETKTDRDFGLRSVRGGNALHVGHNPHFGLTTLIEIP